MTQEGDKEMQEEQSRNLPSSTPKLGPERFEQMIDAFFPAIYMTLLSIIQSVALGYLVMEFLTKYRTFGLETSLLFANTFIAIALVWHHYCEGMLALRWKPTIVDSLLPFSIGFTECLLARFSSNTPVWFLLLGLLFILGFFVSINAYVRMKKEDFETEQAYKDRCSISLSGVKIRGLGFTILPCAYLILKRWPQFCPIAAIIVTLFGLYNLATNLKPIGWTSS